MTAQFITRGVWKSITASAKAARKPALVAAAYFGHTPQPDARSVDLQRVAIDDAGLARQVVGKRYRHQREDQHRARSDQQLGDDGAGADPFPGYSALQQSESRRAPSSQA